MPEISTAISSRLFYRKMGSGPAVVLLHGFPESGTLWRLIWDDLSAEYTLIIPDFPGSGNSSLDKETTIDEMAECVRSVLDAEGIAHAVIAGHSMGGYTAFAFARLYPGMVAGLSAIHSSATTDDEEKKKNRLKAISLIERGAKKPFISEMVPNLFSEAFKQTFPMMVEEQVAESLKMDVAGMVNFYKAMISRKNQTDMLPDAVFPVQWVVGMEDNVISYKRILEQSYVSAINFVTFYRDCAHMSMMEAPVRLSKDLKIFIDYCFYQHQVV